MMIMWKNCTEEIDEKNNFFFAEHLSVSSNNMSDAEVTETKKRGRPAGSVAKVNWHWNLRSALVVIITYSSQQQGKKRPHEAPSKTKVTKTVDSGPPPKRGRGRPKGTAVKKNGASKPTSAKSGRSASRKKESSDEDEDITESSDSSSDDGVDGDDGVEPDDNDSGSDA